MGPGAANPTPLTLGPGSNYDPPLSRDPTRIAFSSTRDGNSEIYAMNADETNQQRVTNNAAQDEQPPCGWTSNVLVCYTNRDVTYGIFGQDDAVAALNPTHLGPGANCDASPGFGP